MIISCNTKTKDDKIIKIAGNVYLFNWEAPFMKGYISNTTSFEANYFIYSTWDTCVNIFDLNTNKVIFKKRIQDLCYAKPKFDIKNGRIYFPSSDSNFECVDIKNGKNIWNLNLNGKCKNFSFVNDSIIISSIKNVGLAAINSNSGKLKYEIKYNYNLCNLPETSPWEFTFDKNNFYVSNWECGGVTAFDIQNGKTIWDKTIPVEFFLGNPILIGDMIFVGMSGIFEDGKVVVLNKHKGEILYEYKCKYQPNCLAKLYNDKIVFFTDDQKINVFNTINKKVDYSLQLLEGNMIASNQFYLVDNYLYFSTEKYNINQFDMKTNKLEILEVAKSGILDAFKYNDKTFLLK